MWKVNNLKKFIVPFFARRCAHLLLAVGALMLAAETRALPVQDTTFGTGGVARIGAPGGAEDGPAASILQSDGKLLVAGSSDGRQSYSFVLRFDGNGSRDASFGQNGVLLFVLPDGFSYYNQQIEQRPDGSILVGGIGSSGFVLTRISAAGVIDPAFGSKGFFTLAPGAYGSAARFVQQSDGGILIVSDGSTASQSALRLTRLSDTGLRETRYAPNGEKFLYGLPADFELARGVSVAAEPDGGFTAIATARANGGGYLLARVTDAGTLNFSFGNGGQVTGKDLGNPYDKPVEMVRTHDGRLLLLGDALTASGSPSGKTAMWRLTSGGLSDPSFGGAGRIELDNLNINNGYSHVAPLVNGGFIVSNYVANRTMRFDRDGTLDSSFGVLGTASIGLAGYGGFGPIGAVPKADGGLLLPGAAALVISCYGARPCSARGLDLAVANLDSAGLPLAGYGRGDGFAVWNRPAYSNDRLDAILVEPAGKVLLAGFSDEGASGDFMLARLHANGLPDTSFGGNGRVLPKQFSHFVGSARAVEQANGAITVAAGTAAGSYGNVATVTAFRLDAAGVLDAAFTPALAAPGMANATVALGVRPDSRLLYGTASHAEGAVLQQLLADGTPDSSFGSNGKVAFPLDEGEFSQESDLLVQADGSVVFAVLTDKKLRVFKLDARGLPPASFGTGGQFSYAQSFEQSAGDRALSLLALADGSLLAAIGTSKPAAYPALPSSSLLAIRIAPNGALTAANSLLTDSAYLNWRLLALPDASVLIARSRNDRISATAALYRLLPGSSFDPDFGTGGAYPLAGMQKVSALALDANGRLLVAGQDADSAILLRYGLSVSVVEYYNPDLRHYFITANPSEMATIDGGGAGPGWQRTGFGFRSYSQESGVAGGALPVCRFYGTPGRGPNSHFYTANSTECQAIKADPGWTYEGIAFYLFAPVDGKCGGDAQMVYRVYNNRFVQNDSNHRYTTDLNLYAQMQSQGWLPEGVVFCAPAQ